ncbi:MAG: hypothetical protein JW395_2506 [Nitrospira sp.]|nr:hypothetical protein [Nitrospira sp.]
MWPFANRGARANTSPTPPSSSLDYAAFADNGARIKIWVPEILDQALNQLSVDHDESKPDVLRALLFEHAYGRLALEGLIAWKRRQDGGIFRESVLPYGTTPPRTAFVELFGKSTEDISLDLPQPLKDNLVLLATHEGMGLSDYVRKTLVRMLLGEKRHQQWRAAIGDVPTEQRRTEAETDI